jgi:hypothetical protein
MLSCKKLRVQNNVQVYNVQFYKDLAQFVLGIGH